MIGKDLPRTWRRLGKAALIGLSLTVVALVTAKLNIFNLEAVSGEVSDDLSQRLGLVSYTGPFGRASDSRPGQHTVRAVTLDEDGVESLKNLGWSGWPPGYDQLAIMIEDLNVQGGTRPRAIFLDFLVTGQNAAPEGAAAFGNLVQTIGGVTAAESATEARWGGFTACQADPLVKLACMVAWGGTPVILAATTAPTLGQQKLSRVALLSPIQIDERNYPLVERRGDAVDLYPAAALYAAHCLTLMRQAEIAGRAATDPCGLAPIRDAWAVARALHDGETPPVAEPARDLAALWSGVAVAPIWSTVPHPDQARLLRNVSSTEPVHCKPRTAYLPYLLDQAFGRRKPPQGDDQACEYTLWMGYDRLAAGYGLDSATDYPLLLADKLVIVGARFANGNDWVRTPLHGAVPGAFYHAMALDNLVELGRDFRRPEPESRIGLQDALTAPLTFMLMTMAAWAGMARRAFALDRAPHLGGRLPLRAAVPWHLLVGLAILGVAVIYILIAQVWVRSVVVNWIGVLSIVFGALAAATRFDLLRDIEDDLSARPGGWIGRAMARARTALDPDHDPEPATPNKEPADG